MLRIRNGPPSVPNTGTRYFACYHIDYVDDTVTTISAPLIQRIPNILTKGIPKIVFYFLNHFGLNTFDKPNLIGYLFLLLTQNISRSINKLKLIKLDYVFYHLIKLSIV